MRILAFTLILTASLAGNCLEQIICEGNTGIIKCAESTINIQKADYGRTDKSECHYWNVFFWSKDCTVDWTGHVKSYCQSKQQCEITPSNDVSGDPCKRVYKYLNVDYECLSPVAVKLESKIPNILPTYRTTADTTVASILPTQFSTPNSVILSTLPAHSTKPEPIEPSNQPNHSTTPESVVPITQPNHITTPEQEVLSTIPNHLTTPEPIVPSTFSTNRTTSEQVVLSTLSTHSLPPEPILPSNQPNNSRTPGSVVPGTLSNHLIRPEPVELSTLPTKRITTDLMAPITLPTHRTTEEMTTKGDSEQFNTCYCPCNKIRYNPWSFLGESNLTYNEIKALLQPHLNVLKETISVDKSSTNRRIRTRISSRDGRLSSAVMGYIGAAYLASVIVYLESGDVRKLLIKFLRFRNNLRKSFNGLQQINRKKDHYGLRE